MLMSWPLFFQWVSLICIVVFALFSLNQPLKSDSEKVLSVQNTAWQLLLWFIFCHLSEKITEHSFGIVDALYDVDWLMMNVRERKLLKFMIARAQKEFRISCIGMFDTSLATFSTVIIDRYRFLAHRPN